MLLNMDSPTPLTDGIRREVFNKRRNYAIIIVGKTQTRKSTYAVKLASMLWKDFDMERDMAIIKAREFLRVLQEPVKRRGEVRVLDEFGVGMDHRMWHSFLHKAVIHTMETHGFKGLILIVTVPYSDLVDRDALKFFDMRITCLSKDDKKKFIKIKVEELEWNEDLRRLYKRFPRGRFKDGMIRRLDNFVVGYPDKETMERYYAMANPIKELNMKELHDEAKQMEQRILAKKFNAEAYIQQVIEQKEKFLDNYLGRTYISIEKIRNEFSGMGIMRAKQIKSGAETKLGIGRKQDAAL